MKAIIDFATWYSGMERAKVERAYQRYLRETKVDNKSVGMPVFLNPPPPPHERPTTPPSKPINYYD